MAWGGVVACVIIVSSQDLSFENLTGIVSIYLTFNLESTESDKYDHLSLQLKLWFEEPDHQLVFLTSALCVWSKFISP